MKWTQRVEKRPSEQLLNANPGEKGNIYLTDSDEEAMVELSRIVRSSVTQPRTGSTTSLGMIAFGKDL